MFKKLKLLFKSTTIPQIYPHKKNVYSMRGFRLRETTPDYWRVYYREVLVIKRPPDGDCSWVYDGVKKAYKVKIVKLLREAEKEIQRSRERNNRYARKDKEANIEKINQQLAEVLKTESGEQTD